MPSHRTGCHGGIRTDLEFVAQQALQGVVIHEEHHDVRRGAANLKTETPSAQCQKNRGAPAMGRAGAWLLL